MKDTALKPTERTRSGVQGRKQRLGVAALALLTVFTVFTVLSKPSLAFPQDQSAHPKEYPELPAGPGKDTLVRVCSKCHSPDTVMANGQSREGWEQTITKMVSLGAVGTDDEFSDILEYLVKNYPAGSSSTVNVNKATAVQIETGLGLSTAEATALVQYREKNGPFKAFDDLKKVPELTTKNLDAKKARIAF